MPTVRQGDIHDYDFGPRHRGRTFGATTGPVAISKDEFNRAYGTALALPRSRTMPAERYRNQRMCTSRQSIRGHPPGKTGNAGVQDVGGQHHRPAFDKAGDEGRQAFPAETAGVNGDSPALIMRLPRVSVVHG